jgi:hypothetical protein
MNMLASDSGESAQRVLIKKFTLIRQKQLFLWIIIPSLFMLRKYFAIFRTRALIHAYTPDDISRGFYKFYSYNTKKLLTFPDFNVIAINGNIIHPETATGKLILNNNFIIHFFDIYAFRFQTNRYY